MTKKRVYLVIGADRKVRAAVNPRVQLDEIAIAINLTFPDTWGRVLQTIDVDVPDFAPQATVDGAS
jgi:hypothetical protein